MISFDSLPPPEAANDNDRRFDRRGGETYFDAMQRTGRVRAPDRETPLAKAFRDGRAPDDLAVVAAYIETQCENAIRRGAILAPRAMKFADVTIPGGGDFSLPVGQEIAVDARRAVRAISNAAGYYWPAVFMALFDRLTMFDIGSAHGAPTRRAAKVGLAYVLAGLRGVDRELLMVAERRFLRAMAA